MEEKKNEQNAPQVLPSYGYVPYCPPEEDEIDLLELYAVLKKRKKLIWMITGVVTLIGLFYVFIATPIYQGSMTLEVGKAVSQKVIIEKKEKGNSLFKTEQLLDDLNNLKDIIEKRFDITANYPKKATAVITYTAEGPDKKKIEELLNQAWKYTLKRHKEIIKLYAGPFTKVRMTRLIKGIDIGENPIKPKKKLIVGVAFITGLIFSIFLAFFLEFIQKEENR